MRRIEYDRYGGPELMHVTTFAPRPPRSHEVQIKVTAASINPFDWKLREGELKIFTGSTFPRGMGSDFSGVVQAVGPKVKSFKIGEEVIGTTTPKASGAFAEIVTTHKTLLVRKPASLSHSEAAVLPIPGVTAWLALVDTADVQRGQTVFINGALGGVGRAAIAIAKARGAKVAGRVSGRSLSQGGADDLSPVLDYAKPIPAELKGGFDVVFDCNGSLTPEEGDFLRKAGGVVIDINLTKKKLLHALLSRRRKLVFFNGKAETLAKVVALAAAGDLSLPVGITVALDDAIPLLAAMENGKPQDGKAVIQFA
jgi:NADPH:quinone reductase-like Zn-dependent oxidoreductase